MNAMRTIFPLSHLSTRIARLFVTGVLAMAGSVHAIEIWLIAPEDSSKWIAKPDTWDAVITREDTIRLKGLLEEKGTDFVLIQINEKDYPLWILGSSFDTDIPLERGENTVTAEVRAGDYKKAQLKVIRVDNITDLSVSEMVLKDDGSEQSLYAEEPVEISSESKFRTRIPRVQISGQHNLPKEGVVEAFFQERNERLPVAIDANTFTLNCSLMQGDNSIVVRTKMGRNVVDEQTISVRLDKPVELAAPTDEEQPAEGVATTDRRRFVTTNQTYVLKGRIPGVAEGKLNVTLGDQQVEVPITDHQFEHTLQLEEGAEHQISLSLPFGDQHYFDQVTVQHYSERIEVMEVHVRKLGTRDFEPLIPNPDGYRVASPSVALHGESVSSFPAWIRNGDFVSEIEVSRGRFVTEVPLREGENEVEFFLGSPEEPKALDSILFTRGPIIQISHDLTDDNSDGIFVFEAPSGDFFPAGIVPGMQQGSVLVTLGEEKTTLPVTNGVFRADKPLVLLPSTPTDLVVNVKDNDQVYTDQMTLMWKAPLGTDLGEVKRVITPPRPIKTVLPEFPSGRFKDRGKKITVSFVISALGKIEEDSFEFDSESEVVIDAIKTALTQWEFDPARENGVPVSRKSQMVFEARAR